MAVPFVGWWMGPLGSRRPARPLLGLCAAIVVGSAIGAMAAREDLAAPPDGTAITAAVIGARTLLARPDAWRALVVTSLVAWTALLVVRGSHPRAARVALLVACAALCGLRASDAGSTISPASNAVITQREGAHAEEAHPGLVAGVFEASAATVDLRGRVGDLPSSVIVPRAIVAPGETVVLDPVNGRPLLPRGPEPGPRARSGSRPAFELAPDEIARVAPARRGWFAPLLEGVRDLRATLAARARTVRDPDTRGILLAILVGDTSELPQEMPDLFVRTGTFHLLAVSGMQVVLVVLLLIGPASRLAAWLVTCASRGRWRVDAAWFAVLLVVLFVPIAGAGAPIVRSALGAAFALVAPGILNARAAVVGSGTAQAGVHLARRADSLSFWSFALILECALHPDAPLSLSVQLSYSATLGLIVATGPCLALLREGVGERPPVAHVTRTGRERSAASLALAILARRTAVGGLSAVAASTAAVGATLPFVWSRLCEWSPWGILATPVLAPSMAALLGLGWLRVLFGALVVPDELLVPCARAMTASMRAFDLLPFTPAPLPPRPGWLVALACTAALACVVRRRQGAPVRMLARIAALAWVALLVPWRSAPARVEIHALQVGAGTAVVIEGPGLGTWVFDAGSRDRPDVAREALGPLLRRIDPGPVGIVLSHADRDHDAALPWLVERFPPSVFAGALPAHIAERLPHAAARIDVTRGRARLPELAGSAGGVGLVLERGLDADGNEGSRSLRIVAGGEQALLCGDAEEDGLREWIRIAPHGRVRLLLWPHHGSEMELIEPLLRAVLPDEVWISASGIPPVHSELVRRALVTQCTARDGPLHLVLGGGMDPALAMPGDGRGVR